MAFHNLQLLISLAFIFAPSEILQTQSIPKYHILNNRILFTHRTNRNSDATSALFLLWLLKSCVRIKIILPKINAEHKLQWPHLNHHHTRAISPYRHISECRYPSDAMPCQIQAMPSSIQTTDEFSWSNEVFFFFLLFDGRIFMDIMGRALLFIEW